MYRICKLCQKGFAALTLAAFFVGRDNEQWKVEVHKTTKKLKNKRFKMSKKSQISKRTFFSSPFPIKNSESLQQHKPRFNDTSQDRNKQIWFVVI